MRIKLVGVVALMALVVASYGGGAPEAAGSSEGIVVHGAWTIDVYNPDGSLDKHLEFNNALTSGGVSIKRFLLGEDTTSNIWAITFGESTSAGVCPSETTGRCVISPITAISSGAAALMLSGSTIVEAAGTIEHVNTRLGFCPPTGAPSDCFAPPSTAAANATFTARTLDAGDVTTVSVGQTVQIQVEISFTSG
jgi:hypothetical protein